MTLGGAGGAAGSVAGAGAVADGATKEAGLAGRAAGVVFAGRLLDATDRAGRSPTRCGLSASRADNGDNGDNGGGLALINI